MLKQLGARIEHDEQAAQRQDEIDVTKIDLQGRRDLLQADGEGDQAQTPQGQGQAEAHKDGRVAKKYLHMAPVMGMQVCLLRDRGRRMIKWTNSRRIDRPAVKLNCLKP